MMSAKRKQVVHRAFRPLGGLWCTAWQSHRTVANPLRPIYAIIAVKFTFVHNAWNGFPVSA
jgi:hypothetical protein